ncbi:MAG: aminoacyl-histidine dipeptidase [Bacteroidota bacterium]|nr:aminoacyl-histidine dipeptidase [Bacteroidota bacterium]
MNDELKKLKPESLWQNFVKLTEIPRPSKKEAGIIRFMMDWGKDKGLETINDDIGNVIMKKPATKGMEDRKTVVLQGHLDMVPQKNNDKAHDFEKDPITAFVDGDWVTADGTTLGADNGMGVAAIMSVLEADNLKHGPIEALFTIDEETGMTGAFKLKPGVLNADILMNLDSEDEGELYIGCAGGVDTTIYLKNKQEKSDNSHKAFEITVTGLKGGHSGMDIPLQRGNANKVLFRLLKDADEKFKLKLASVTGGDLRNAIPRESVATVTIKEKKEDAFSDFVKQYETIAQKELSETDAGLKIKMKSAEMPAKVMKKKTFRKLYRIVNAMPHGPERFIDNMPEIPETSINLCIVKSGEKEIMIGSLIRSSVDSAKENLQGKIESIAHLAGAKVEHTGEYPGWKPNFDSPILQTMKTVYSDKFGKTPDVKIIHAGLECGVLGATYPNWDMISFGPTIRFPHSPDEKVNIATVQKFWDYLIETLKNVPSK